MTREEIRNKAIKEQRELMESMDWRGGFICGAEMAVKTIIEKACKWLINIDFDGYDFRDCDESFDNDLFVDAFRKAMEK